MQNISSFGGGPTYMISWLIDGLINMIAIHDWFIPLYDTHTFILCLIANICFLWSKPIHHSGTLFTSLIHSIILFWVIFIWYACSINQLSWLLHLLVDTRSRGLEGCYGLYRTFRNLTPELDPVFLRPPFSEVRSHT